MGTYTGTGASDVIVPGFTSAGVTEVPAATTPSGAADTLNGGGGADFMDGGDGNDTYFVDNEGDITVERFNDALGGVDNVFASASHTIGFGIENLILSGTGDIDGTGNANANQIIGNNGDNVLNGLGGNDDLFGSGGDDELRGGEGADDMFGGFGNDTYFVENAGDTVNEVAAQGTDTVNSLITLLSLSANVENLTLAGAADLNGTGNALDNVLTGNGGSNDLFGLEGDDTLDGGAGADDMDGGEGSDTYFVDDVGDTVTDDPGDPGIDEVNSSVSFNLGAGVENLILLGLGDLDGNGNSLANEIAGNEGDNTLTGKGGADELSGLNGEDNLDGGNDNDKLFGGGKADNLFGAKGKDDMSGEAGGDDFIYTNVNQSGITNATRDRILDFKGQDVIDLSAIDADKGQGGNQDFSLDGNGNFQAGEIQVRVVGAGVIIDLNVDGDAAAEMSILLKDFSGTLNNNDFVF